jgi:hypothetical protein
VQVIHDVQRVMERVRDSILGPFDATDLDHRTELRNQLGRLRYVFLGERPEAFGDVVFLVRSGLDKGLPAGLKDFVEAVQFAEIVYQ